MPAKYKKRADGRYLIQISIGQTPEGKPKYKNIYARTVRELEEKAARVRDELEKGIHIDDKKLTFEAWAWQWMDLYKSSLAYKTQERKAYKYIHQMYRTTLKVHICPALGALRLKDIKAHHAQTLVSKLVNVGKTRMAQMVMQTLRQIFARAVKNEYLHKNIMDGVEIVRHKKQQKRTLTDAEISCVRSAVLPLREKTFVVLLLTTGLRRGEALALAPSDIDMQSRTISVSKTAIVKSNAIEVRDQTKTQAGMRTVPITDELHACLTEYLPTITTPWLFSTTQNKQMTAIAFRRMWEKIINAMNIAAGGTTGKNRVAKIGTDITPHIFRHTYATLLYNAGVDVKTAQYLLGHASLQVTLGIYTHLSEKHKNDSIGKFNAYMENAIQSKISQIGGE